MQMATIELCVEEVYSPGGTIPRDVRVRSDFSRFDPRPEVPHFSNFGPPMGGGLRCAEPAYFTQSCRQVADFSRFGAHLRPAAHVSRFDPKVRPIPHLVVLSR